MKTIEIIVAPNGETRIETKGFQGPSCVEATRRLEAALGRKTDDRLTAEFHMPAQEADRLRASGE